MPACRGGGGGEHRRSLHARTACSTSSRGASDVALPQHLHPCPAEPPPTPAADRKLCRCSPHLCLTAIPPPPPPGHALPPAPPLLCRPIDPRTLPSIDSISFKDRAQCSQLSWDEFEKSGCAEVVVIVNRPELLTTGAPGFPRVPQNLRCRRVHLVAAPLPLRSGACGGGSDDFEGAAAPGNWDQCRQIPPSSWGHRSVAIGRLSPGCQRRGAPHSTACCLSKAGLHSKQPHGPVQLAHSSALRLPAVCAVPACLQTCPRVCTRSCACPRGALRSPPTPAVACCTTSHPPASACCESSAKEQAPAIPTEGCASHTCLPPFQSPPPPPAEQGQGQLATPGHACVVCCNLHSSVGKVVASHCHSGQPCAASTGASVGDGDGQAHALLPLLLPSSIEPQSPSLCCFLMQRLFRLPFVPLDANVEHRCYVQMRYTEGTAGAGVQLQQRGAWVGCRGSEPSFRAATSGGSLPTAWPVAADQSVRSDGVNHIINETLCSAFATLPLKDSGRPAPSRRRRCPMGRPPRAALPAPPRFIPSPPTRLAAWPWRSRPTGVRCVALRWVALCLRCLELCGHGGAPRRQEWQGGEKLAVSQVIMAQLQQGLLQQAMCASRLQQAMHTLRRWCHD